MTECSKEMSTYAGEMAHLHDHRYSITNRHACTHKLILRTVAIKI